MTCEAAGLHRARRVDRFVDGLAGDEPAREAPRVRACRSGRRAFQRWAAGESMEESLRDGTEHQWVRMGRLGASRC